MEMTRHAKIFLDNVIFFHNQHLKFLALADCVGLEVMEGGKASKRALGMMLFGGPVRHLHHHHHHHHLLATTLALQASKQLWRRFDVIDDPSPPSLESIR